MAGFNLFMSNRMERLVEALAQVVKRPLSSPFDPETIVVQSQGMEKWLAMELAVHQGICANYWFPFPNSFMHKLFEAIFPGIPKRYPYDPEILTWRIMGLLPSLTEEPAFISLKNYIQGENRTLRLYQLSRRIANAFDQYVVFRPEMVLSWEQGEDSHWQAVLWRELVRLTGRCDHMAFLGKAFIEKIERNNLINGLFPERVSIFGAATLPPLYLRVLHSISRFMEVNFFFMNPCSEYWGDIVSHQEAAKILAMPLSRGVEAADLYLRQGNSILASTGAVGREFLDLLLELSPEEKHIFHDPGCESILSSLQSDILNLREPETGSAQKRKVNTDDLSIQIHSCHGPMREMEVLQDRILDMLERIPGLVPNDILVMTPDLDKYTPFIHAVFDLPRSDPRWIPFSVADRKSRDEISCLETFMKVLDLAGGRFTSTRVMEILTSPNVAMRHQLSEADLEVLENWVGSAGVRWGKDKEERRSFGLPDNEENTWKAGVERLLLGYAMPGFNQRMFKDILPYDHIEGKDAQVLGNFLVFFDQLKLHTKALEESRTLSCWADVLRNIMDGLFMEGGGKELQRLRKAVSDMAATQEIASFRDQVVDVSVIREHLGSILKEGALGYGFLDGGITFCAMVPMRSIPRKVICLAGLNSDIFPGRSCPPDFDIMASNPKKGDRSRRKDDRYLFLEALLSARDALCITYVGQDIVDNSPIPPSVLVNDLMDYLEKAFVSEKGGDISGHVKTTHRLQAFSPAYFNGGVLFSYSKDNLEAAKSLLQPSNGHVPFFARQLSDPGEEWYTVSVETLCDFFVNPARFILKRRLGIYLEERDTVLEEKEPFEMGPLDRYKIAQEILAGQIDKSGAADLFYIKKAAGDLPHGAVGELQYLKILKDVDIFSCSLEEFLKEPLRDPVRLDVRLCGFNLVGTIKGIYGPRLIRFRHARLNGRDRLRLWIELLCASLANKEQGPFSGILAGWQKGPEICKYSVPEESQRTLSSLLGLYKKGLRAPLKFFPEASWQYSREVFSKGKSKAEALATVMAIWNGEFMNAREKNDPYVVRCFGEMIPLDETFQDASERVYAPLLDLEEKLVW